MELKVLVNSSFYKPYTSSVVGPDLTEEALMRGYSMSTDDYQKRLRRIEGQVRGIQRMIDEDTYCIDVLHQISAVTGALQNVAIGLLDEHVGHCVTNAAAQGDEARAREMVTEATRAIERLVKT